MLGENGEPVQGAQTFSVEPSDGVLNPPIARTDANGQASSVESRSIRSYTQSTIHHSVGIYTEAEGYTGVVGWVRSDGFARTRRDL